MMVVTHMVTIVLSDGVAGDGSGRKSVNIVRMNVNGLKSSA